MLLLQTIGQTQMDKRRSLDVAVAVSGGALLALLAILLVVITVIVCQCFKKRKLSPNKTQQRLYSSFTVTLLTSYACMTNVVRPVARLFERGETKLIKWVRITFLFIIFTYCHYCPLYNYTTKLIESLQNVIRLL